MFRFCRHAPLFPHQKRTVERRTVKRADIGRVAGGPGRGVRDCGPRSLPDHKGNGGRGCVPSNRRDSGLDCRPSDVPCSGVRGLVSSPANHVRHNDVRSPPGSPPNSAPDSPAGCARDYPPGSLPDCCPQYPVYYLEDNPPGAGVREEASSPKPQDSSR